MDSSVEHIFEDLFGC